MDKSIIEQYADMIAEREDLQKRIKEAELKIKDLCKETVADSVTLGRHGKKPLGRKVIRGNPSPEIARKRAALRKYKAQFKAAEIRIDDMIVDVQQFIDEIEISRIRRMFRYRFIDQLTWQQVAFRMGKHHTAESCRKTVERFMKNL